MWEWDIERKAVKKEVTEMGMVIWRIVIQSPSDDQLV